MYPMLYLCISDVFSVSSCWSSQLMSFLYLSVVYFSWPRPDPIIVYILCISLCWNTLISETCIYSSFIEFISDYYCLTMFPQLDYLMLILSFLLIHLTAFDENQDRYLWNNDNSFLCFWYRLTFLITFDTKLDIISKMSS